MYFELMESDICQQLIGDVFTLSSAELNELGTKGTATDKDVF